MQCKSFIWKEIKKKIHTNTIVNWHSLRKGTRRMQLQKKRKFIRIFTWNVLILMLSEAQINGKHWKNKSYHSFWNIFEISFHLQLAYSVFFKYSISNGIVVDDGLTSISIKFKTYTHPRAVRMLSHLNSYIINFISDLHIRNRSHAVKIAHFTSELLQLS